MSRPAVIAVSLAAALLAGCDLLELDAGEKLAAAREAEGRAVGGACRHAGRAIEDCYVLNKRVDKAAIFAGWRDMNDYMRENKLDPIPPQISTQVAAARPGADAKGADDADEPAADKRVPAKGKARDVTGDRSQGG